MYRGTIAQLCWGPSLAHPLHQVHARTACPVAYLAISGCGGSCACFIMGCRSANVCLCSGTSMVGKNGKWIVPTRESRPQLDPPRSRRPPAMPAPVYGTYRVDAVCLCPSCPVCSAHQPMIGSVPTTVKRFNETHTSRVLLHIHTECCLQRC